MKGRKKTELMSPVGDKTITGPTTGVVNIKLEKILLEEELVNIASKDDKITFPCSDPVRHNDSVYLISLINSD
jgi:hypothetical protein